jgi:hypothetical protein
LATNTTGHGSPVFGGRLVTKPAEHEHDESGREQVVSSLPSRPITVVRVFSSTTMAARGRMGNRITEWLACNQNLRVVKAVVTASSDREFHYLSIVLFCEVETLSEGPPST